MKEFEITTIEASQNLLRYLCKLLPNAPVSIFYKGFRKKNITLNDKRCSGKEILHAGDMVRIWFSDNTFQKFKSSEDKASSNKRKIPDFNFADHIIYEDAHIIIVDKPSGILSQSNQSDVLSLNDELVSYCQELVSDTFRPSICNRLDRNTSGIVLCGKTIQGLQTLNSILKDRSLHKNYRCVVLGKTEEKVTLKAFLVKNERTNEVHISKDDQVYSVPIETRYTRLSVLAKESTLLSLLDVLLVTGRSHQIRAHLSFTGHPILGDKKYGNKKSLDLSKTLHIHHQLLHAYSVTFPLDLDGELSYLSGKTFTAPVPWKL